MVAAPLNVPAAAPTGADLGVSLLIGVHRGDELRLCLAPRVGVAMSNTETETTISGLTPAQPGG